MQTEDKVKFKINFRPLVVVFLSLLLGIISARKLYLGDGVYIALIVIVFVSLIVYSFVKVRYLLLILTAISFFVGNGLYFLSYNLFVGKEYQDADISGRVCYVEYDADYGRTTLTLENVVAVGDSVSNVYLSIYETENGDFQIGDVIVYNGNLEHRQLFTLGSFNSSDYRDGVAYNSTAEMSQLNIVSGGLTFDEKAREAISDVLYKNMDAKYAGIAYAVLVGDKSGVDENVYSAFSSSGIIHILTVSGLHVTFLTSLIAWILKKCRVNKFVNFIITFVLLLTYAYICGFTPSVIRAMIMGLILISAGLFGRRYDGAIALSCAGILTLLISPLSALDVGFLMSYGCVASIFVLQKPISKVLKKFLPNKIADLIAISLATQVGILPFLASFFSELNFLSFFANLIVVPFFGILFPLLIVLVVLVMIIPPIGPVLMACQWGFIAIEYVANFFASTSFKIYLTPLDPMVTCLIFLAAFACSYFLIANSFFKWFTVAFVCLILACYTMTKSDFSYRGTSVSLLSSGYSNTLVLESKSGSVLCVNYNEYLVKYYLSQEGLKHIDYILDSSSGDGQEFGALILEEEQGFASDFKYSEENGIYKIEFDDVKILFTNISNSSYNNLAIEEALAEGGYDFVFAENYQPSAETNYFIATYESFDFSDYSVKDSGSFKYIFDTGKAWRID